MMGTRTSGVKLADQTGSANDRPWLDAKSLPLRRASNAAILISVIGEIPNNKGHGMAIDDLFRALGDPTRREILRLLREGDLSAGELAARFPLAKSTLSGHFAILRHAGLIVAERQGTTIVYSLSIGAVEELVAATMALFGVGDDKTARETQREVPHGEELAE